MQVDAYWMPDFVSRGLIQKLDGYIKGDKTFKLDDFLPGAFLEHHHIFKGAAGPVAQAVAEFFARHTITGTQRAASSAALSGHAVTDLRRSEHNQMQQPHLTLPLPLR